MQRLEWRWCVAALTVGASLAQDDERALPFIVGTHPASCEYRRQSSASARCTRRVYVAFTRPRHALPCRHVGLAHSAQCRRFGTLPDEPQHSCGRLRYSVCWLSLYAVYCLSCIVTYLLPVVRSVERRLLALVSFRRFCRRRRCRMAQTSPSSSCRRSCPRSLRQPAPPLKQLPLAPPPHGTGPPVCRILPPASPTDPTRPSHGSAAQCAPWFAIGHGSQCGCPQLGARPSTAHSVSQARERLESEAQRRSQMEAMNRRLELEKRYTMQRAAHNIERNATCSAQH